MKPCVFLLGLLLVSVLYCPQAHGQGWNELLDRAGSLYDSAMYDSGIVIGRLALEEAEEQFGPEDTAAARVLNVLGLCYREKGHFAVAESLHVRSLTIRERRLGPEHPQVAGSLMSLACNFYFQFQYAEAEALYGRSLAVLEKAYGPEHLDVANVLYGLALACRKQARYSEAESFILRSLTIREKLLGRNHIIVANTLNVLANNRKKQGRFAEAEPLARRVLEITEAQLVPDSAQLAVALNGLATLYLYTGRWSDAEPLLRRSLSIRNRSLGPGDTFVATSLYNLYYLYKNQGDLASAETYLQQALTVVEDIHGPDHPDVARCVNSLGNLRFSQRRFVEAERLWTRALAINKKVLGPENVEVADGLGYLGNLKREQGELAEAERLFEQALVIKTGVLGDDHPDVASSLTQLAGIFSRLGRYSDAEDYLNTSSEILERSFGSIHPTVAASMCDIADLYVATGREGEAEEYYLRALDKREKVYGKQSHMLAHDLGQLSRLYRLQSRLTEAVELAGRACAYRLAAFRRNCSVLSERDALEYSQYARTSLDNYLSCIADLQLKSVTDIIEVSDVVLSGKELVTEEIFERQKSVVLETDSTVLALAESLRYTKYQLSNLYVDGPGDDVNEYRLKLDSLETMANDLESELSPHSASYRRHQSYQDVSTDRVASFLPDGAALVEYFNYDYQKLEPDSSIPRYLAVVVTNDSDPVLVDLGDASETDSLIHAYRKHMTNVSTAGSMATGADLEEYRSISNSLHQLIWQPLEGHIGGRDLALIAPDGALNSLSFAGLTDCAGRYLVESLAIHYLSAGRDLVRNAETSEAVSGLFALGNPDYNASISDRLNDLPSREQSDGRLESFTTRNVRSGCVALGSVVLDPLPGTYREIREIVAAWERTSEEPAVVCFGEDASEDRLKAEAPGSRVVHIATHGYFLEGDCRSGDDPDAYEIRENPLLRSGLFFSGANLHGDGTDSAGLDDGILTALEVSAIDLSGTELVVLSACETGLGEIETGEGVYGLRRAFQIAGARTVLSTLWPVSDGMTAEASSRLYDRKGASLPEAIRNMQLEQIAQLRQQNKVDHPFSWGAIVASGNWR